MTKVFLIGNLTRDPELTETSGGVPVCRFGVAVNRGYGENRATDFYNVTAWRRLGEQVAQYTKKGNKIAVYGDLQIRHAAARDWKSAWSSVLLFSSSMPCLLLFIHIHPYHRLVQLFL